MGSVAISAINVLELATQLLTDIRSNSLVSLPHWDLLVIGAWALLSALWYRISQSACHQLTCHQRCQARSKVIYKKLEPVDEAETQQQQFKALSVKDDTCLAKVKCDFNLSFDCEDDIASTWSSDEEIDDEEISKAYRRALVNKRLNAK